MVPPTQAALGFPLIPGVSLPDGVIVPFFEYDFGPGFRNAEVSGVVSLQPPTVRWPGCAACCSRRRSAPIPAGIPLPAACSRAASSRSASGRRTSRAVAERFLLPDDAEELVAQAEKSNVLR
ncbi:MAG: hypothetical protein RJA55_2277 [Acidobacteriota bacterium]|jgi:hypothetical protein